MDWSAGLSFTLAKSMAYPEVCDYALDRITKDWSETWCPWGLTIVRVKCDGLPELVNPAATTTYPLDLEDPKVKAHCGAAPPAGPCVGHCGGKSPEGCWCDAACTQYGDCCSDVKQSCPSL